LLTLAELGPDFGRNEEQLDKIPLKIKK
jgi:hypothetical protein